MPLNEQKGNMYAFVTHTFNTVKGACPHGCHYCYMTKWGPLKPVRFDESELKTDLGSGNFIFVGSSCDLFAVDIPQEWTLRTLKHCWNFGANRYLFQTKDVEHLCSFTEQLPPLSTIGTTIETNRIYPEMGNVTEYSPPDDRSHTLAALSYEDGFDVMVTIEPIMDFDLDELVQLVDNCGPEWVNIGANTHPKVKVPEPSGDKVRDLIAALEDAGITVKQKDNLKRLLK